jgi:hypothetical protein
VLPPVDGRKLRKGGFVCECGDFESASVFSKFAKFVYGNLLVLSQGKAGRVHITGAVKIDKS